MIKKPLERVNLREGHLRALLAKEVLTYFLTIKYRENMIPWYEGKDKYHLAAEDQQFVFREKELVDIVSNDEDSAFFQAVRKVGVHEEVAVLFDHPEYSAYRALKDYIKEHRARLLRELYASYPVVKIE